MLRARYSDSSVSYAVKEGHWCSPNRRWSSVSRVHAHSTSPARGLDGKARSIKGCCLQYLVSRCTSACPHPNKRPAISASFTRSLGGTGGTLWRPMRTHVSQGPRVATKVPDRHVMAGARRETEMVAAWSVDRLDRSLTDLLSLSTNLHAKGLICSCIGRGSIRQPLRAAQHMLGVFTEFECAMIRERLMTGLARARAEGK
jgi:hypothetical protein